MKIRAIYGLWVFIFGIGTLILLLTPRGAIEYSGEQLNQTVTLVGASQFGEAHVYTRTLRKFESLVREYYAGPVKLEMYLNSELGLEKDYFGYMSLGIAMDYSIVTASHMSGFASEAPLIDTPFLFRDYDHWSKVVTSDVFQPIKEAVYQKADVLFIGFAGGGVRNLIVNRPVRDLSELNGLRMRVMGAPIQANIFQAIGAVPSVIAYNEVYNAIQTGVIEAVGNIPHQACIHAQANRVQWQDFSSTSGGAANSDYASRSRSRRIRAQD
jgi:TRAP-type transport system periplasmic protein